MIFADPGSASPAVPEPVSASEQMILSLCCAGQARNKDQTRRKLQDTLIKVKEMLE